MKPTSPFSVEGTCLLVSLSLYVLTSMAVDLCTSLTLRRRWHVVLSLWIASYQTSLGTSTILTRSAGRRQTGRWWTAGTPTKISPTSSMCVDQSTLPITPVQVRYNVLEQSIPPLFPYTQVKCFVLYQLIVPTSSFEMFLNIAFQVFRILEEYIYHILSRTFSGTQEHSF